MLATILVSELTVACLGACALSGVVSPGAWILTAIVAAGCALLSVVWSAVSLWVDVGLGAGLTSGSPARATNVTARAGLVSPARMLSARVNPAGSGEPALPSGWRAHTAERAGATVACALSGGAPGLTFISSIVHIQTILEVPSGSCDITSLLSWSIVHVSGTAILSGVERSATCIVHLTFDMLDPGCLA